MRPRRSSGPRVATTWLALCSAAALAGCQSLDGTGTPAAIRASEGLAFAQGSCGGCHAVEAARESPNPAAPAFAAIVNQPGLTQETLTAWLIDAHNYPQEMEFYLESDEVRQLVAYMLTLRDENYRPPI